MPYYNSTCAVALCCTHPASARRGGRCPGGVGPCRQTKLTPRGPLLLRCAALLWPRLLVIHRDLKPANLLVERKTFKVKVCDFGLAQRVARAAKPSTHKHTQAHTSTQAQTASCSGPALHDYES